MGSGIETTLLNIEENGTLFLDFRVPCESLHFKNTKDSASGKKQ